MDEIKSQSIKVLYIYDELPQTYQNYLLLPLKKLKQRVALKVLAYQQEVEADYSMGKPSIKEKVAGKMSRYTPVKKIRKDIAIMKNFDVVHLQHSYLFSKLDVFKSAPENKKPKLVITLRGGDTYIKPWTAKRWADFYSKQSHHINAFVVVSNHQKEYLQKWGVASEKIQVISVSFGETTQAAPKSPNPEVLKIVSAHRLCWEKNIDANLQFIKAIKNQGIVVTYDVYGDGPNKGQLLYLIDKYELSDIVTYHAKIENEVLKKQLTTYDFFLQLSLSESLGVSVLEAQSLGLPVIVSDTGGLPETLAENKSGFILRDLDFSGMAARVVELWKDKKAYHSFSQNAITYSHDNFNVEKEVHLLEKLYQNLVSNKSN